MRKKPLAAALIIILAVATMSLALFIGPPSIDCGWDRQCFLAAAKVCARAALNDYTVNDFGSYQIRLTTRTEIMGFNGTGEDCAYRVKVTDAQVEDAKGPLPAGVTEKIEDLAGLEIDCLRGCSNMTDSRIPGADAYGGCSGGLGKAMNEIAGMSGGSVANGVAEDAAPGGDRDAVVRGLLEGEIIGYVFPENLNLTPGSYGNFEIGLRNVDYVGRCFLIDMKLNGVSPPSVYTSLGCADAASCGPLLAFVSSWFSYGRVIWIDGQGIEFHSGYVLPPANASGGAYTFEVTSWYSNATLEECDRLNDFSTLYHHNKFDIFVK